MFLLTLLGCGSSEDPNMSRKEFPSSKKAEKIFHWAETADSLQIATYNTFIDSEGVFKQDNRENSTFHYWWNAHMLDVLVDGYIRSGDDSYLTKMKALVRGIKARNSNQYQIYFNDDMEWLGISCLRAYTATQDEAYLKIAKELWHEVKKGWSEVHGGGIMWRTDTPNEKNACSNGPGAILALGLYEINNKPEDLAWAEKIYKWQKSTLVDPLTGLVWDHVKYDSKGGPIKDKESKFSYNQGTYIGAATELYKITQDRKYLEDAIQTAGAVITSPKITFEGVLKNEGQGDGGLFKGILVRNLTILIQNPDVPKENRERFVDFLTYNAQSFYANSLERPAMMVGSNWTKLPQSHTDLSTQLSGIMLMEMAAKLKLPQKKIASLIDCTEHLINTEEQQNSEILTREEPYTIVVLGSSTAAGAGPSSVDNAWVWRFSEYLSNHNKDIKIINLAVGGFATTDILPTGNPEKNITKALSYEPDAVIINLPSNDAAQNRSVEDQLTNYQIILGEAYHQNIPVWVTTPQPRNFEEHQVEIQKNMVEATYAAFQEAFIIDLWNCFADEKGWIKEKYNSGDGVHLNDLAHQLIYKRVIGVNIPKVIKQ